MEKTSLKTLFKTVLPLFLAAIIVIGCGKDDGADNPMEGYPKDVAIRYEVSSTTNNKARVTYTNEIWELKNKREHILLQ